MSKNRTCGECKNFQVVCDLVTPSTDAEGCDGFEKKARTNGDVIRQGGNRDFAEYFIYESGAMFASTLIVDKTFDTFDEAIEATMEYLNAPAESEVEDE